jgi:hypothetical protein
MANDTTAVPIPSDAQLVPVQQPSSQSVPIPADATLQPIGNPQSSSQAASQSGSTIPKNYGFTPGHIAGQAWQGTKELAGGLYQMGKDVLFPEGTTESEKLKFLAHKYIIDPARIEEAKAQSAQSPLESVGHSIAEAIPVVGPWAANLGEQAGTGDVGGALARGGVQVAAAELGGKAIKATKELAGKGLTNLAQKTGTGGFTPEVALEKAGRPAVYERNFKENVQRALPRLIDENKIEPIKDPEGMADAPTMQRKNFGITRRNHR